MKRRKPRRIKILDHHGPEGDPLTSKERVFVSEYLSNGWNALAAARTARYSSPQTQAYRVLEKVRIRNEINAALRRGALTAEQITARLGEMATANASEFVSADGRINRQTFKRRGYLIKGLKPASNTKGVEIELHDAQAALDKLAKINGLYKESGPQVQVSADGGVTFVIGVQEAELP